MSWFKQWVMNYLGIQNIINYMANLMNKYNELNTKLIELYRNIQNIKCNDKSPQFPETEDIEWEYKTFKFTNIIFGSVSSLILDLEDFEGLKVDFRFKNQSNHRIYIKVVGMFGEEWSTAWMDAGNALSPIGIISTNGIPCLDIQKSSTNKRYIHILPDTPSDAVIYIHIGIPIGSNIKMGTVRITPN